MAEISYTSKVDKMKMLHSLKLTEAFTFYICNFLRHPGSIVDS